MFKKIQCTYIIDISDAVCIAPTLSSKGVDKLRARNIYTVPCYNLFLHYLKKKKYLTSPALE